MVTAATWIEFQSASTTPRKPKKNSSEAVSKDGMSDFGKAVTSAGADSALTRRSQIGTSTQRTSSARR
jgi:hypothetical protein